MCVSIWTTARCAPTSTTSLEEIRGLLGTLPGPLADARRRRRPHRRRARRRGPARRHGSRRAPPQVSRRNSSRPHRFTCDETATPPAAAHVRTSPRDRPQAPARRHRPGRADAAPCASVGAVAGPALAAVRRRRPAASGRRLPATRRGHGAPSAPGQRPPPRTASPRADSKSQVAGCSSARPPAARSRAGLGTATASPVPEEPTRVFQQPTVPGLRPEGHRTARTRPSPSRRARTRARTPTSSCCPTAPTATRVTAYVIDAACVEPAVVRHARSC